MGRNRVKRRIGTRHIALGGVVQRVWSTYGHGISKDGKLRLSIGIVLALLSWFTMLCHTLPGFLAEIARDGYSKEKVAIHEWHLYMQAVEHSPNIRRLRMRYAACKSQIAGQASLLVN